MSDIDLQSPWCDGNSIMFKRILSAIFLIPVVLAIIFWAAPLLFAVVVTFICSLAFYEFAVMGQKIFPGVSPWRTTLPAMGIGLLAIYPFIGEHRLTAILLYFILMGCITVATCKNVKSILPMHIWPVTGFVYIFVLLSFVYDIRFRIVDDKGSALLLFFLLIQWIGDTFAYFTGRIWGRHKLAPVISPKKTIEGTLGGLLGSTIVGLLISVTLFQSQAIWLYGLVGLVVGGLGQLGDLLESMFKRTSGVKDSSNLIPGHGGMLDRLDSVIFTAPVYFGLMTLLRGTS